MIKVKTFDFEISNLSVRSSALDDSITNFYSRKISSPEEVDDIINSWAESPSVDEIIDIKVSTYTQQHQDSYPDWVHALYIVTYRER